MERSATRLLLAALLTMSCVLPGWAQDLKNVTFQVDLSPAVEACQFVVGEDSVQVRGSFNDWAGTAATDDDGDNIYTATLQLPPDSTFNYKFWATGGWGGGDAAYEGDPNRSYTVTADADQDVPVVELRKTFDNICGAEELDFEVEFRVDMSVAKLSPRFNPDTDVVTVAGPFNGWSTPTDTLQPSFLNPDVYTKVIRIENQVPGSIPYKFVIGKPNEAAPAGWESGSDRQLVLTGEEEDVDGNGYLDATNGEEAPYFDRVTPDQVFLDPATVVFEVDLRPAFYFLADSLRLPSDTQTGEPVTELTGLWINGPVAQAADQLQDWATWGPDGLAQIESRELVDDGTKGDAVAGDSIFTLTYNYPAGTARLLTGKFGASGFDNEGGFGADHRFWLQTDQPVRAIFGAPRGADSTLTDLNGPSLSPNAYDPYIDISVDSVSATVVRRGGSEATGVEQVGKPAGLALKQNHPNPFRTTTSFEYSIPQASLVKVRVFDVSGRQVATLVDGYQAANTYRVTLDGSALPSGVYIVRLDAGADSQTRRIIHVK